MNQFSPSYSVSIPSSWDSLPSSASLSFFILPRASTSSLIYPTVANISECSSLFRRLEGGAFDLLGTGLVFHDALSVLGQVNDDLITEQGPDLFNRQPLGLHDDEEGDDGANKGEGGVDEEHAPLAAPTSVRGFSTHMPCHKMTTQAHMFLNASGEGAVKVMVPTKMLKRERLTPLARSCVGKISAVQINVGASTHCHHISAYVQEASPYHFVACLPGRRR